MPVPATIDDLLELGHKSGILDRKELDEYLERVRASPTVPDSPRTLAQAMVRDGLLTRFQAEQLLQGKWRNFLISNKYKLLERLGQGGMGIVFLCEHVRLRRRVALKVLPPDQARDPGVQERFYREGRAVATLNHPNIVKVHDIDSFGKLHYLVMEYVEGASLEDIVQKKGPMDVTRACHYLFQAALGLQHAHEQGIVHRDVKPANILLDRQGRIKVLDLGLARFFHDQADNLTNEHDAQSILGTVDYLAPEQASGDRPIDHRTDIHALGLTFYFLLAGRPPFVKGTLNQKVIWALMRNPESILKFRPDVPPEVAAILQRMIEKDPADRYQSLAEVAEALAPWAQVPIDPPPTDEMPSLSPAALGPPTLATGTASGPALNRFIRTPAATMPSPGDLTAIRPARHFPRDEQSLAVKPEHESALPGELGGALAGSNGRDGSKVVFWGRVALCTLLLASCVAGLTWWALVGPRQNEVGKNDQNGGAEKPPGNKAPPSPPPRPNLDAPGLIATLRGHTGPVERVSFSPNGKYLVSCSHDRTIGLWSVESGALMQTFRGHTNVVHDVVCAPDGRHFASAGYDGKVFLWDFDAEKPVRAFQGHTGAARSVAISRDGHLLVSGVGDVQDGQPLDCTIRLWQVEDAHLIKTLVGHTAPVWSVAISRDGKRIVSGSYDGTARAWDVATGKEVSIFEGHHPQRVHSVAIAPDSRHALTGSADRTARLWDTETGEEVHRFRGHTATVAAVAFSPDGGHVLTGSDDRTVRLWETATGKEIRRFDGHMAQVWGVAFAPNGRLAVSASADKTVCLWGLPIGR